MIGYYGIKKNKKKFCNNKLTEIISIPWVLHAVIENRSSLGLSYDVNELENYVNKCAKRKKIYFGKGFNFKEVEIPDEYITSFIKSCNSNKNSGIINGKANRIIIYVLTEIYDEKDNWWKFGKSWNEKWE